MSDALSLAEIDSQRVELLPARTVLSSYCGSHYHYCCGYSFDYDYSYEDIDQTAEAEANQYIINIGGNVYAENTAVASNEA